MPAHHQPPVSVAFALLLAAGGPAVTAAELPAVGMSHPPASAVPDVMIAVLAALVAVAEAYQKPRERQLAFLVDSATGQATCSGRCSQQVLQHLFNAGFSFTIHNVTAAYVGLHIEAFSTAQVSHGLPLKCSNNF